VLHLDFETRSQKELRGPSSVGLWNYANDPSTEPLMLSWAFNNDPVEVWEPRLGEMPKELLDGLQDPSIEIGAFNSTFERYILQFKLGIVVPIKRFQDPQASARYLSLPGDLAEVSTILGLTSEHAKEKRGKALIELFCKPHKLKKKKKGEEAIMGFFDWDSHPSEWLEFIEYCRMDTIAEREVLRREKLLGVWPLPTTERKVWELDQRINDRGIPVDVNFVRRAYELANREKQEMIQLNNTKTGLSNSNSNTQLTNWAVEQGYKGLNPEDEKKYSLDKDVVKAELKNNASITPLCREVLENIKNYRLS
jgi:DNA polymerase